MNRRGFTLIEMTAVLTIGTIVVGIGVGALHLILRTERTGRDHLPRTRILMRLAGQFRDDARMALDQSAEKNEMQFTLPDDRQVIYRALSGSITREERQSNSKKLVRQESYVLPDGFATKFMTNGEGKMNQAILILTDQGKPTNAGREMRIVAMLGKDHRFATTSTEEP